MCITHESFVETFKKLRRGWKKRENCWRRWLIKEHNHHNDGNSRGFSRYVFQWFFFFLGELRGISGILGERKREAGLENKYRGRLTCQHYSRQETRYKMYKRRVNTQQREWRKKNFLLNFYEPKTRCKNLDLNTAEIIKILSLPKSHGPKS